MPRNTSGIYSLPAAAGNPVVASAVIQPTWANQTLNDVAAEITGSLPRNGSAPMTAPLLLVGDASVALAAVPKQQLDSKVAADIAVHNAVADPHPQYALDTDLSSGLSGKQNVDPTLTNFASQVFAVNEIPVGTVVADVFAKRTIGVASGNIPEVGTKSATELLAGLSELATRAEAEAGVDDTVVMTALKTKQARALVIHVREEQPTATGGGATVAGDQTRILNTVVKNTIAGATLATNEITLPAGTYSIVASAPAYLAQRHRARLFNVTDAVVQLLGNSEYAYPAADSPVTRSHITGEFTIAAAKVFRITHFTQAARTVNGLGVESNDTFLSVYTSCVIRKLA